MTSQLTCMSCQQKSIGVIDGTHISAHAPACKSTTYLDRSSDISQTVMCACIVDMRFTYVHASWEGSAHVSWVMQEALHHLRIIEAFYTSPLSL